MIDRLAAFAEELRAIGIPVSMVEVLDAAEAMSHVDLSTSNGLRAALGATMVKSGRHRDAFDRAFDVFFELGSAGQPLLREGLDAARDGDGLVSSIAEALNRDDRDRLLELIREAVQRFGQLETGRSGGSSYHAYRVLRRLDPDAIRDLLIRSAGQRGGTLDDRLAADRADRLVRTLREEVHREALRRLVEERGVASVARSVREPLVEDLDLQHATLDEIKAIEHAIAPLARKLATRLSQRRRHGHRGRLDVRGTIRRSLPHGGAFVEPRFRKPRVAKPQIVLLCDTSGSVATFSRFTLQLTHAIVSELSGVRSFVFVEGVDEVTGLFGSGQDFEASLKRIATAADVYRGDGHSDYGASFAEFTDRYLDSVTPRTTVIVTGDARTNYRTPAVDRFQIIADRSRAVFWLNPEPERFWDTGDSVMGAYASRCDRVEEVRSLRQLEGFIERAALPIERPSRSGQSLHLAGDPVAGVVSGDHPV